jgi:hypothetical protein
VRAFYETYVNSNYPNDDGLMMDDTASSVNAQFYYASQTSSYEEPNDTSLLSAHAAMAANLTKSDGSTYLQIDNGDGYNPYLNSATALLNNPNSVVGLVAEGAPWDSSLVTNWKYETLLDDMAYVNHTNNDFEVLLSYDPSGTLEARRIQAATILLGYSPGHTVSWSDLEQSLNTDLTIWPEEGVYPTNPVQSMSEPSGSGCFSGNGDVCPTGGHNDLEVSSGIYRREFQDCYNQGTSFGPCAVIVNDTSSSVTVAPSWLTQSYSHVVTMSGGDVQSGGSINLSGSSFSAGSTQVPANDALILAP